jgi:hypothetical protein
MKNAEKRAAILFVIDSLRAQLAAMPVDESSNIEPDAEPSTSPFLGRPMVAKRGGACAVCGGSVQAGSAIVYNGTLKAIAHSKCCVDDQRGPR